MREQGEAHIGNRLRERLAHALGRGHDDFEQFRTANEGVLVFTPEERLAMEQESTVSLQNVTDAFLRVNGDPSRSEEDLKAVARQVMLGINTFTYCHGVDAKDMTRRTRFAKAVDYCMTHNISLSSWPVELTPIGLIAFVEEHSQEILTGHDLGIQQELIENQPNYAAIKPLSVVPAKKPLRSGEFNADGGDAAAPDKKELKKPRRWGRVVAGVALVAAIGVGLIAAFSGSDEPAKAAPRTTTTTSELPTTTTTSTTTTTEAPTTTVAMTTTSGIPTTVVTIPAVIEAPATTTTTTTTAPTASFEQGGQPTNSIDGAQQAPKPIESVDQKRGTTAAIPGALILKKGENVTNQLQDLITGSHGSDIDKMPNVNRAVSNILRVIAVENNRSVMSLNTVRVGEPVKLDAFSQAILQQAQAAYRS